MFPDTTIHQLRSSLVRGRVFLVSGAMNFEPDCILRIREVVFRWGTITGLYSTGHGSKKSISNGLFVSLLHD